MLKEIKRSFIVDDDMILQKKNYIIRRNGGEPILRSTDILELTDVFITADEEILINGNFYTSGPYGNIVDFERKTFLNKDKIKNLRFNSCEIELIFDKLLLYINGKR